MKIVNTNIRTDGNQVEIGKEYLYTEYKFPGYVHGIKNGLYKFIVEILNTDDNVNRIKIDCKITLIIKNKNEEAEIGDEFEFSINKKTNISIWKLEEISNGLDLPIEYGYIGPEKFLKNLDKKYKGFLINDRNDIEKWILQTDQITDSNGLIIATFIINLENKLLINDRHSEHVQCANGENILSAGEIGFVVKNTKVEGIEFISNQSTGYCPSSRSWDKVEKAINEIEGIEVPKEFEPKFEFSYCSNCQSLKIVKDEYYYCHRCDNELYSEDKFQRTRQYLEIK